MPRIEPEEQDFDPESFGPEEAAAAFAAGKRLFDAGEYHAAHEEFERCWLASEGGDADFYKGLIQASICLYHLGRDNVEGARKLYSGHRRLLAAFLPSHAGLDVSGFLAAMQTYLGPRLRPGSAPADAGIPPSLGNLSAAGD